MDKKLAAENLLQELTSYHGAMINQVFCIIFPDQVIYLNLLLYLYELKMCTDIFMDAFFY